VLLVAITTGVKIGVRKIFRRPVEPGPTPPAVAVASRTGRGQRPSR